MTRQSVSLNDAVTLLPFGTYDEVGTDWELSDNTGNYKFIVLRFGSDTNQSGGGGAVLKTIPTFLPDEHKGGSGMFEVSYMLNEKHRYGTFIITNGKLIRLMSSNNYLALRAVYGVR